jgi:hypothetical protein
MSKLLEEAFERISELPKERQDSAARALMLQLDQVFGIYN